MNSYGTPDPSDVASLGSQPSLPLYSSRDPLCDPSRDPALLATPSPPSAVQTGHSCVSVVRFAPFQVSSGPNLIPSPDHSTSMLPGVDPGFGLGPGQPNTGQTLPPETPSTPNLFPAPTYQVSVIIPSPDLHLSPLQSRCSENTCPDLECAICFSQFNNVFRCPKMLQCRHTFCLECLARINVKSAQPSTIQCPLCRGVTTLPALGLPRLATDASVLTYLPAAMQRVYSIRFLRNKGRLQVKRSFAGMRRWRRRSARSLDVGLPSPPARDRDAASGVSEALSRLMGRPACRAFLLTSVVLMIVLLMGIIVFLFTFRPNDKSPEAKPFLLAAVTQHIAGWRCWSQRGNPAGLTEADVRAGVWTSIMHTSYCNQHLWRRPPGRKDPDQACRWLLLLSARVLLQVFTEETHTCTDLQSQSRSTPSSRSQEGDGGLAAAQVQPGEEPWRVQTGTGPSEPQQCVVS
ncbi:RING finger protein 225 isoform X5 [Takifugu flavidus]|uniref:RING finger protein 225 isoform X5 n=1 Tax=Takifugu flavidus TaxID=433684 RepID=UPI002544C45E|nr:RING finger protein 225 isoform X5 [Takifugu flavidus]